MRLFFWLFLIFAAQPAFAASFDCAKAKSATEKLICSDPDLSQADSDLNLQYEKTLRTLPEVGKKTLRKSQTSWLHYVRALDAMVDETAKRYASGSPNTDNDRSIAGVCSNASNAPYEDKVARSACLASLYKSRIEFLSSAIEQVGPYTVQSVRFYDAVRRLNNEDTPTYGVSINTTTFPEIESPVTPDVQKLNDLLAIDGKDQCDAGGSQTYADETIISVSRKILSIHEEDWMQCESTSHGYGSETQRTLLLNPAPHELNVEDMFQKGSPWKKVVAGIVQQTGKADGFDVDDIMVKSIDDNIDAGESWQLTKEGLLFKDAFEETPDHPLGDPNNHFTDVLVPWQRLKPYMIIDPATFFQ